MDDFSKYTRDPDLYYAEAFKRNIGLLNLPEQKALRYARVAIVGAGGVGGFHLMNLVRAGVGGFHIADMDTYDIVNIQRQYGARMDTLGKNKALIMKEEALAVNPHADIKVYPEGISESNVDDFFSGVDIFIDGIDFFSIEKRRLIFRKAKEHGLYAITAGPVGFSSAMLVFSPQGMSFDDYFDIRDDMSELEKLIAFAVGLAPAALQMKYIDLGSVDLSSRRGPSFISACTLCASLATTEAIDIFLMRKQPTCAPHYLQFDLHTHILKKGYLLEGNKNLIQRLKRWYLGRKFGKAPTIKSQAASHQSPVGK